MSMSKPAPFERDSCCAPAVRQESSTSMPARTVPWLVDSNASITGATATSTVADRLPPGPLATIVYVVFTSGATSTLFERSAPS